jgi:radical SAM superfamily enzyme with C-terminal helix-hairpin-helix motif
MIHIRGIIVPVNWDESGNVAGLGIETFDEDFFLIDNRSGIEELFELVQEAVELGGNLIRKSGKKIISVIEIRRIRAAG